MAGVKKRRTSLVRNLLGHDPPPQKLVLRGMADLEKALDQRFKERKQQREALARANAPLWNSLRARLGDDPAWAATVQRKRRGKRKAPRRRLAFGKSLQQKDHIFLGSLGGTRVCPFDYEWWWKNGPTVGFLADASHGEMEIGLDTAEKDISISARTAVGIFFQSPSHCISKFSFWASPAVSFSWDEIVTLSSAHSDGFVGLFAASYDWAGNFTGTLVDQMISLWNDDSWWWDSNGSGSSNAFPLSASFLVDPDHWYALWVWCGSDASADGEHFYGFSTVDSGLVVQVPSISWQVG